jgi:hypothetical protein
MRLLHASVVLVMFAAFAVGAPAGVRADANSEMVIKAVMIRKFVEFIKWPEAYAPQKNMQVNVCVLGDSPMSQMSAVFDKTGASPIKYKLSNISQLSGVENNCHVVFLGASALAQLPGLRGKPVLTVSDSGGFAERGGMIGFEIIGGKIRYNINNRSFGAAQLMIDAQLLEIANKVVE